MTYLLLKESISLLGLTWPAGPMEMKDIGWARKLTEAGARVITRQEFEDATVSAMETDDSGEGDAGDPGSDQISVAVAIRNDKSRRPYRRVS